MRAHRRFIRLTILITFFAFAGAANAQPVFGTPDAVNLMSAGIADITAADLDGDTLLDVIVALESGNAVFWQVNLGDGGFGEPNYIDGALQGANSVYATDIDMDGDVDVAATGSYNTTYRVMWYENDGSGSFLSTFMIDGISSGPESAHAGDLDGDGDPDVAAAMNTGDQIVWYRNQSDSGFSDPFIITNLADGANNVQIVDLDGDLDLDVVSSSERDGKFAWYANDGNGNFGAQNVIGTVTWATDFHVADMDGDLDMDLVGCTSSNDQIILYTNDGSKNFTATTLLEFVDALSVHVADMDNDGDNDILYSDFADSSVGMLENLGGGTFAAPIVVATGLGGVVAVHAADMDNATDIHGLKDLDVLIAERDANTTTLVENRGNFYLTYPDGGETLTAGTVERITWSIDDSTDIWVEYSTDGGSNWFNAASGYNAAYGGYDWTVAGFPTTNALVRVTDMDDLFVADQSEAPFTIKGSVALVSPNGGETWRAGETRSVNWTADGADFFDLDLSLDSGATWTNVASGLMGNDAPFGFTVPPVSSDRALMRIRQGLDTTVADTSDATFTILNPTMSVASPAAGETRVAGVSGTIEWESQDIQTVVIEYSTDGGSSWNHIATGSIQSRLYNWTTPPFPTSRAKVRVSDDASAVFDESGEFAILLPNSWTGAVSDDWADTSNWSEGATPTNLDYAVIPPTANDPVVRAPITNVFVGGLTIESEATLRVESQVDTFKTRDDVLINGTLEALGEPEFVVGGDWYNDPLAAGDRGYVPGLSTVRFSGTGVLTGAFYNLEVDSGAFMTTSGSVTVSGTLTLAKSSMEMNPQDTLTIFSDDTLSVTGDGLIICGTIVRALMTGTGAVYRYESPLTTVRYPDGNEPDWYAMSTFFEDPDSILMLPNAKPIANAAKPTELTWIVVPDAALDTAAQTFTIEDAEENGIWTFGFIDSATGKPKPDEIAAGARFMRRTYRGSSGRNIPKPDTTTAGPTYTFRWDKADMPSAADTTIEDDWSELLCFTLGEPVGSEREETAAATPTTFALEQNYPNPFNPATTIRYALPEAATVRLTVFNVLGERVATLVNGKQDAGFYEASFEATRFATGVYFYRIDALGASGERFQETRKMLLIK